MYCTYCGTKLNDDAHFCTCCGKPTAQPAAAAAAASTAQPASVPGAGVFTGPVYVVSQPPFFPGAAQQPERPVQRPAYVPGVADAPVHPVQPIYRSAVRPESAAEMPPVSDPDGFDPEVPPCKPSAPLTVWQTMMCYLALFCLPIGNILFACIWGFSAKAHPQRRTLARAALPFISLGLIVLFGALLWITRNLTTFSFSFR